MCVVNDPRGRRSPVTVKRSQITHTNLLQNHWVIQQHLHTQTHTHTERMETPNTTLCLCNSHMPHLSLRQCYSHASAYCEPSKHSSACVYNNGDCGEKPLSTVATINEQYQNPQFPACFRWLRRFPMRTMPFKRNTHRICHRKSTAV